MYNKYEHSWSIKSRKLYGKETFEFNFFFILISLGFQNSACILKSYLSTPLSHVWSQESSSAAFGSTERERYAMLALTYHSQQAR